MIGFKLGNAVVDPISLKVRFCIMKRTIAFPATFVVMITLEGLDALEH